MQEKNTIELPSAERLTGLFEYDEASGSLTWKLRPVDEFKTLGAHRTWNTKYAGKEAGTKRYNTISKRPAGVAVNIDYTLYLAHRIIWAMVHGHTPTDLKIDHKNGDPFDNRLSNIRLATQQQNIQNRRFRTSVLQGVDRRGGVHRARLKQNGKALWSGHFPTKGLAAVAYAKASLRYFGKFSPYYPHP